MTPDRLFLLCTLLAARQQTTAELLAAELGVSVRTVLRDLDWLRDAGFAVVVTRGRHGGVSLVPGGTLPVGSTSRSASALELAPATTSDIPGLDERQRGEISAGNSPRSQRLPLSDLVAVDNRGWFEPPSDGVAPATLLQSVRSGRRLRVRYRRSGERTPTWREVDPYGLLAKAGRWYLVADHAGRPRLFAAIRLDAVETTHTPRQLRPDHTLAEVARELTASVEDPGELLVTCRLASDSLDLAKRLLQGRIREVRPDTGEADAPETVIVVIACRALGAVRQLLQFGDQLQVLDPPEARERLLAIARDTIAQYATDAR